MSRNTRVFIGQLPYEAREGDLEKFFRNYGRINEINLKRGYGFVDFVDYRDAEDAVVEMNGKPLLGERVILETARGKPRGPGGYIMGREGHRDSNWREFGSRRREFRRDSPPRRFERTESRYEPPRRTGYRLRVENLSSRCSWQDLKDYMRQAGEVTFTDANRHKINEGIVEFASRSDMKTAIRKLDGTDINGRKIKLVEVKRSVSKSRSRSRSRSRDSKRKSRHSRGSRSRSRSRSKSKSRSGSRSRKSKSKSKSKSRSRSRSHSRSKSKSHSRSRSRTPAENGEKADESVEKKDEAEGEDGDEDREMDGDQGEDS